ncbi:MAG: hypothetical protein Q7R99_01165 [bacterium]|nr:hypothetical protein [bacterium]
MRKIAILISLMVLVLIICGCGSNAGKETKVNSTETISPVNYGNGVYYFAATQAAFGNSLSKFIANHSNLTLISIADDSTDQPYGVNCGYFVVFR